MTYPKALLFDFDGVLADTEPIHWRAWLEALAPYSPSLDWELYESSCVGIADIPMLHFFMKITKKPMTLNEVRGLYSEKRRIFQKLAANRSLIDQQLVLYLSSLRSVELAVVTSSNQAEVEPVLKQSGILNHLSTVVYGNDVKHFKPHPEPYQLAMKSLQLQPAEAIVFEDSESGIRSGLAAGCRVVIVQTSSDLLGLVQDTLADRKPA